MAGVAPTESRSPNESCAEKNRLQRAYSFAMADLGRAVQVLYHYTDVLDREEYERVRKFANETLCASEQAQRDLERHIAKHGC